jgi:hypothetical protein
VLFLSHTHSPPLHLSYPHSLSASRPPSPTLSFICVTGLIHMCDVTRLLVWHDSFICVT